MEIQPSRQSDDTDLRRAYVHLAEAQRLSQTGSFTWDFDRGELLWSEELCRIFEFDPATTITTDLVGQYVHPADLPAFAATLEGAAAGGDVDFPYRIVTASGVLKHLHAVGHRIEHAAERPVIIGAVQDVTERKVAEEALDRARAELAHVARIATLSALTASIAHEVNQPLTSLVTNASTCLRMLRADRPNLDLAQTTAQRVIRDANRASEVIQRLRAMFVRKEPAAEAVDLNEAAEGGTRSLFERPAERTDRCASRFRSGAAERSGRSHPAPAGHSESGPHCAGRDALGRWPAADP